MINKAAFAVKVYAAFVVTRLKLRNILLYKVIRIERSSYV